MSAQQGNNASLSLWDEDITGASPPRVQFFSVHRDHGPASHTCHEAAPDEIGELWNESGASILLVENPNRAWETRLSQDDIRPTPVPSAFWERHRAACLLPGTSLWESVFHREDGIAPRDPNELESDVHPQLQCDAHSIRGIFEYGPGTILSADPNETQWRRPGVNLASYGPTLATRVTYGRFGHMYIILVDAPRSIDSSAVPASRRPSPSQRRPVLRLPHVVGSRGGLLIPPLFLQDTYSLFESFESFFSHSWHASVLFSEEGLIEPNVLLTLLCISLWQTNLRLLRTDIEDVSFVEMRKQTRLQRRETSLVNDRLHDRREDLAFLRREVQYLHKWIYDEVEGATQTCIAQSYKRPLARISLDEILEDSRLLQMFLMDTFQLWMAILSFENTLLNIDQITLNNQIATDNGKIAQSSEVQAREAVKQADANNKILEASNQLARASEARAREAVEQAKANNAIMETNNKLVSASVDQAKASNAILAANNQIASASVAQAEATRKILEANNKMAAAGEKRADESISQTSRATALTFLAALYLPMTLASGLFGMNIREISDSNLASLRQFGGTLGGLVAGTVLIMVAYYANERRMARRREARRVAADAQIAAAAA